MSLFVDLDRPPLNQRELRQALVEHGPYTRLEVLPEATSTNAVLLAQAASASVASGSVILAEYQTAGHGRLSRPWQTPPRTALLASVLFRPPPSTRPRLTWLPLLAGLATAQALDRFLPISPQLKWPNDIVIAADAATRPTGPGSLGQESTQESAQHPPGWTGFRKLAGILVELTPDGDSVVIGIGLNILQRSTELPVLWATSLAQVGAQPLNRAIIAKTVLRRLADQYGAWERADFGLNARIQARCVSIGREISVDLPGGGQLHGRGLRLDSNGALVIRYDDSTEATITAGDVGL